MMMVMLIARLDVRFEIDDSELEGLSDQEVEDLMYEYTEEEMANKIYLIIEKKTTMDGDSYSSKLLEAADRVKALESK